MPRRLDRMGGWGLPTSCGSTGQDHPGRQPAFTCERRPQPPYGLGAFRRGVRVVNS